VGWPECQPYRPGRQNLTAILTAADGLNNMTDVEIYRPVTTAGGNTHYIPFRSEALLLLLLAGTGVWLVARPARR